MGYVTENLASGECVVHQTPLHWIIFSGAVVMAALALWMPSVGNDALGGFFLLLEAALAIDSAIQLQTSEFAATNRRVLIKTDLIHRNSLDINLGKAESVKVEQGIFGRPLDYGTIVDRGSGGTREAFKKISDPLAIRMHVQEQLERRSRADQPSDTSQVSTLSRDERECPHCAETILAKAKVFKLCGRPVELGVV